MNVDDIPGQLEELFDRSRAALDQQVTKARKVVANLNVEKTGAAKALAELKDQIAKAKADLDAVLVDLHRASSAVQLDREIAKDRKELERLKGETAKESKALEALAKQRKEVEAHVVALENDARRFTAERCEAQTMIEQIKNQLRSVTVAPSEDRRHTFGVFVMTSKPNPLPDWALDMAKVPFDPNIERAAANFATGGPRSMAPADYSKGSHQAARDAPGSGWQRELELGPQRGIDLIDRMCVTADQRERAQAAQPTDFERMTTAMTAMMNMQSQTIRALALLLNNNEKGAAAARRARHATAAPRKSRERR